MLSRENPPSSDPPCTREISQLKNGGDERASNKVPLQGVDLLKSDLDYDNNPLPKFSLRDYVFSARGKDIKTNWPFSQKNLQLCLKHGVKNLLPPFQTLESVGNRSIERCKPETSPIEEETIENLDGEHSMPTDHLVSKTSDNPGCSQNLEIDCENLGLEGSEGEKQDNQASVNSEIDSVSGDKSQSKNQTPIRKCMLIVNVGSGSADPSSNKDHMTSCVEVSETLAWKVCPVCKTFSSSSNTTLNAHIDQCLSLASNMKWMPKHRIKPRKTRLMTDIYATASHCTLEELDRRNGTNWAMSTSFFTQENEDCTEEKKERVGSLDFKEKGDEGSVYIDANGTKVRILSKFNDVSSSVPKTEADLRIFLKGGKGNKLVSNSKKKHHAQKHYKQSKQFCSPKPSCTTKIRGDGEKTFALVENCRKVECLAQPSKAQEQMKHNDLGILMKWTCSKRTVLFKKRNLKEGLQLLERNFRKEFLVERESPLGDPFKERSCIGKTQNLHENPISSPEIRKRMRDSSFKMPFSECNEEPHMKQLRIKNTTTSGDAKGKEFANNGEHIVPFLGKEKMEINDNICSNPSHNQLAFSSKAPKFSSLKKHVLSSVHLSVPNPPKCKMKTFPSDKKSGMRCSIESHEEFMAVPSEVVGQHDSKPKHSENLFQIPGKDSLCRSGVLKLRKKRGAFDISQNEESRPLKSTSQCHRHEVGTNLDSSARVGRDITYTVGDTMISSSSGVDLGANAMSLSSRSLAPEFQKLGTPSLGDEPEMFCVDKADDSIMAENTDVGEGEGMDSKDGQGNYFPEVVPIPIPGPPGSYLLSPRDMGSDDLQGNSSITSRFHSSEDHRDLVHRDSSNSPISATLTISNSPITRSDSNSSENLFTQDENRLGIYVARSCAAVAENSTVPVPPAETLQSERVNLHELKYKMMVPGRRFTSFRNDQPCCCSRKEGMPHRVSSNYQESQIQSRRTMTSVPTGKQPIGDIDRRANGFNSMPEAISIDNFPVTKSAVGPVSVEVSINSGLSSPAFRNCDSASPSPSASNSVLRLMGKNLMVVNKDENISQQLMPVTQTISLNDHPNQHLQKFSDFIPVNSKSEDFPSFYCMVHQLPNMDLGGYTTSKPPQTSSPLAS